MAVKYGNFKIDTRKKLFLAIEGLPKKGKTTQALTAPGPIILFDIDGGAKGVVDQFIEEGKEIIQPLNAKGEPETFQHHESMTQEAWLNTWLRFRECFLDALDHKRARTVIVDTETEAYELVRLAYLGQLEKVRERYYGTVHAEMRRMIRRAKNSDKNVIFTRKLKPVYIGNDRTKDYAGAGFKDVDYEAEAVVRAWKGVKGDDSLFGLTFVLSRLHTELENEDDDMHELTGPMSSFPFLACAVFPDTDLEDWE